jgi:hypothetical protein
VGFGCHWTRWQSWRRMFSALTTLLNRNVTFLRNNWVEFLLLCIQHCHVLAVTIDQIWIGNWVYWILTLVTVSDNSISFRYTVYSSLHHAHNLLNRPCVRQYLRTMSSAMYLHTTVHLGWTVDFWLLELKLKLKLKLHYDRQSVGQSILVSGTHPGHATSFSFFLKFCLDSCGFVILYRPLWREDGSVIYLFNCFWALPE